MERLTANFASYLQNHTDLNVGDRIAIQLPNVLQFPIAAMGAMRAGMVVVNTNPFIPPEKWNTNLMTQVLRP